MSQPLKAYIASGWFSDKQETSRLIILRTLQEAGFLYYSPKDELSYTVKKDNAQEVFDQNIKELQNCDFVVASTIDKDMGTLFECGCAHVLYKPVIYLWREKGPMNLMLERSAFAVAESKIALTEILLRIRENPLMFKHPKEMWTGEIE